MKAVFYEFKSIWRQSKLQRASERVSIENSRHFIMRRALNMWFALIEQKK